MPSRTVTILLLDGADCLLFPFPFLPQLLGGMFLSPPPLFLLLRPRPRLGAAVLLEGVEELIVKVDWSGMSCSLVVGSGGLVGGVEGAWGCCRRAPGSTISTEEVEQLPPSSLPESTSMIATGVVAEEEAAARVGGLGVAVFALHLLPVCGASVAGPLLVGGEMT